MKTYAVAGHKPWRIGLNLRKLRNNFRIVPVRDVQYQGIHKAKQVHNRVLTSLFMHDVAADSNEAEEFLVGGDIFPLSAYWVELAVDSQHMEYVNSFEDNDVWGNAEIYQDIYAGTFGAMATDVENPVSLPRHVRFKETDGSGFPVHPSQETVINRKP